MMCDHFQMSRTWEMILENLNLFFVVVFTTETVLKIFALRHHYFTETWNLFDFFIVCLSLAALFLSDLISQYFVSPTLLRVVCAFMVKDLINKYVHFPAMPLGACCESCKNSSSDQRSQGYPHIAFFPCDGNAGVAQHRTSTCPCHVYICCIWNVHVQRRQDHLWVWWCT